MVLKKAIIQFEGASVSDFHQIKQYIFDFELDNREPRLEQFLVAKHNTQILGFGRIRHYDTCDELCSLGVIHSERLKGIGKQLVKKLIETAMHPLYLVCIIPEFFEPLDFSIVDEYPTAIKEKIDYCTSQLPVPEKYVVMIHKNIMPDHF